MSQQVRFLRTVLSNLPLNISVSVTPVRSPLVDFLQLPNTPLPSKKPKTGRARVLTSSEAWAILREKEEKKHHEAEEKERRKVEREEKKKQREEEKKHKDEEKVRRTEQRETKRKEKEEAKARMEQKRVHREEERAQKAAEKENKRPAESTLDETGRLRKRLKHGTVESIIDENMCCVCLGLYEEDEDTGRTWLQCTCSRWIHQDCVIPNCSSSTKLCPIC